jgi:hypothetical protein
MFVFAGLRREDDRRWKNQSRSEQLVGMRPMFESGKPFLEKLISPRPLGLNLKSYLFYKIIKAGC